LRSSPNSSFVRDSAAATFFGATGGRPELHYDRSSKEVKMRSLVGAAILGLISHTLATGAGTGVPKKEDVPKYLKMLKTSQSAKERAVAAEMLGKRGAINAEDVEDAIEPLKSALRADSDVKVRTAAAAALGNIGADPETTVPLLIDTLKEKNLDLKMA